MWYLNWNTNLPAGLFSVVSSLNEYICFIIVTHWLGKGGIIGSISPHPWFLLLKIKYEDNTVNAEIFCVNFYYPTLNYQDDNQLFITTFNDSLKIINSHAVSVVSGMNQDLLNIPWINKDEVVSTWLLGY